MNKDYQTGYNSAKKCIMKGSDAFDLLNQAKNSITDDDFDKGWKEACKEHLRPQTGLEILESQGIDYRDFESDLY